MGNSGGGRGKPHPHAEENIALLVEGFLRCSECNRKKRLGLFYRAPRSPSGYQNQCKSCRKKSGKSTYRKGLLRSKYDLSLEEYDILLEFNDKKCWICDGGSTRAMSVDHNHDNGNVRGLLCSPCNNILGRWNDDPEKFLHALTYLKQDGNVVQNLLGRQPKGSRRDE